MLGAPSTAGSIAAQSFYHKKESIMPKRKQLSLTEFVDEKASISADDSSSSSSKRRRVSRRIQTAKAVKVEIKEELEEPVRQPTSTEDSDSDDSVDDSGTSDYEKMRLKNIEDNAKFFASLEIFKAKEDLSIASGTAIKKAPSYRGLKREQKPREVLPRRPRSLRLQRINPQGAPLPPLPEVEPEPESRHVRREKKTKKINKRGLSMKGSLKLVGKHAGPLTMERRPSEPITMVPMNASEENEEKNSKGFIKLMGGLTNSSKPSKNISDDLSAFTKALKKMRITPERVAKVTKDRIFSVAIHPSESKVLVCAGDKWGKIGFWDVESKDENDNGVHLFQPHARPVNCLRFAPENTSKIYSTSYDGTVRCGDFETGVFDEVYATPEDERFWTNSFDFITTDGSQLLVSQNDRIGFVAVVDTRKRNNPQNLYHIHDKNVKTISVHPLRRHYFVTGSTDCTVALWDMRNLKESGKCKPITSLPHGKGVSSAYFSPITGSKILTTCNDDRMRIFNCTESGDVLKGAETMSTIRHNNHVGRWLTGFRANWHPNREDVFVSGSMSRPRQIEVFDDHGRTLHNFMDEENLGSVCSLNAFHPTRNILVGANSSGRLHVFM